MCTDLQYITSGCHCPQLQSPKPNPHGPTFQTYRSWFLWVFYLKCTIFYHPGSQPEPQSLPLFSLVDTELLLPESHQEALKEM